VNIHAEDDPNSVQELENLAAAYPSVPIILAHCLFTANTALVDGLFTKHPNMHCELSARNESMYANQFARQHAERFDWIIFDDKKLKANWRELIEKHPTRFMVGTDTFNSWVDVKKAVRQIRGGLLQNLSPATAKLVASENAIRVMKLEP
jgi:predicted TIM-barrel fold metal-dependent hydrolase